MTVISSVNCFQTQPWTDLAAGAVLVEVLAEVSVVLAVSDRSQAVSVEVSELWAVWDSPVVPPSR